MSDVINEIFDWQPETETGAEYNKSLKLAEALKAAASMAAELADLRSKKKVVILMNIFVWKS